MEVPKDLIKELKNPNRKRSVKTIVHENWQLVEDIDKSLKNVEHDPKTSILVVFMLQNFMTLVNFMVNPRRRQSSKRVHNEEVQEFEEDLRNSQKNWSLIFRKYEVPIGDFVRISKQQGNVDFHGELWQRTRFQKLASTVANFTESIQNRTVSLIPPSRYLFSLVNFVASWTLIPVFNIPKKLTNGTEYLLHNEKRVKEENGKNGNHISNGTYHSKQPNGNIWKPIRKTPEPREFDENYSKFHLNMEQSGKMLSEKEHEWHEKMSMYQKEISARLEVQQKRLQAEIEKIEEEKEERRREEAEDYQKRTELQEDEFQKIIKKIENERKQLSDEQMKKLMDICEKQDRNLLDLFETTSSVPHWEEHEEYWVNRLHTLRSSLFLVRSEFWSFESYLKQISEARKQTPDFIRIIYKMESSSFGRIVTNAQNLINNEHEFLETLFDKYADDLFLRVIWKVINKIATQLDNVILELWSLAVNEENFNCSDLRATVVDIDPYSIPTTWRLKGICNSMDPTDYEDVLSNESHSVYGHF